MSNPIPESRFAVGQLVHHRLFEYRGVVFDVDADFQASDEWYEQVARSRPPRDEPWYHVLVHGATHTTYVAQQNLEADPEPAPIDHPLVEQLFSHFEDGHYVAQHRAN
jgi:heat shock protein HspQ